MSFVSVMIGILLLTTGVEASEKWGKVSKDVLEMTSIPEDPDADAVILFDKGDLEIKRSLHADRMIRFEVTYTRHRRIKILTKAGVDDYADVTIPFWHKDKVKKLEAQTFLSDGSKIKLNKKEIQETRSTNYKRKIFAIPGVVPGAVIEYRYTRRSKYLSFVEPWFFQSNSPTRLSQLTMRVSPALQYSFLSANLDRMEPIVEDDIVLTRDGTELYRYTWQMENVPGLEHEPYMINPRDYWPALYFQLIGYVDYTGFFVELVSEWKDIAEPWVDILSSHIKQDNGLKGIALEKVGSTANRDVQALYDFVRDSVATGGPIGFGSKRLKKPRAALDDGAASPVAKNLLLTNLLRHAGYDAFPVLISTRSHGELFDDWPSILQFNHLIVCCTHKGRVWFMDPGDEFCPYGLLPADDLVVAGLALREKEPGLVRIPSPKSLSSNRVETHGTLDLAGDLVGITTIRFEGYSGAEHRREIEESGEEAYVEALVENRFPSATIDSFTIVNAEVPNAPLEITLSCQVEGFAEVAGDLVYVSPSLVHGLDSNPFKRSDRKHPVEFRFRSTWTEKLELDLPEGYRVVEAPKSGRINSSLMTYTATRSAEKISTQRYFALKSTLYEPEQYDRLRRSYEAVVDSDQALYVLGK